MELANTLAYYDTATKMAEKRNSRKFSFKIGAYLYLQSLVLTWGLLVFDSGIHRRVDFCGNRYETFFTFSFASPEQARVFGTDKFCRCRTLQLICLWRVVYKGKSFIKVVPVCCEGKNITAKLVSMSLNFFFFVTNSGAKISQSVCILPGSNILAYYGAASVTEDKRFLNIKS